VYADNQNPAPPGIAKLIGRRSRRLSACLTLRPVSRRNLFWPERAVVPPPGHQHPPLDEAADLVPVVAQALWRQTERAIHQSLLPGYILIEESSQVLRGRLRESEQLHRHHGLPLPLEIRHDEFTIDILGNQILQTACERMLTVPRVDAESQRMLRRLLRDFSEVASLPRGTRSLRGSQPGSMPATT